MISSKHVFVFRIVMFNIGTNTLGKLALTVFTGPNIIESPDQNYWHPL